MICLSFLKCSNNRRKWSNYLSKLNKKQSLFPSLYLTINFYQILSVQFRNLNFSILSKQHKIHIGYNYIVSLKSLKLLVLRILKSIIVLRHRNKKIFLLLQFSVFIISIYIVPCNVFSYSFTQLINSHVTF